ncbi:hypothetical protein OHA10_39250 [Kribbella sp. NBC_00662]|uniref:hypothetical protein n=1 Tax=Kribbella sp. NBC_00662 TaxID=2975969 RepID=UPI0032504AE5
MDDRIDQEPMEGQGDLVAVSSGNPERQPSQEEVREKLVTLEASFRKAGLPSLSRGLDSKYRRHALLITSALAGTLYLGYLAILLLPPVSYEPGVTTSIAVNVVIVVLVVFGWQEYRGPVNRRGTLMISRAPFLAVVLGVASGVVAAGITWFFDDNPRPLRAAVLAAVWTILFEPVMMLLGSVAVVLLHVLQSLRKGLPSGAGRSFVVMPTVLAVLLIVFVTEDAWRLFGDVSTGALVSTIVLLFALALYLQYLKVRSFCTQMRDLPEDSVEVSEGTSHLSDVIVKFVGTPGLAPLTRAQRLNVSALLLATALVRLLFLGLFTAGILTLFGIILVDERHGNSLMGSEAIHVVGHLDIPMHGSVLTEELLRLAGVLGAFAGLAFSAEPRASSVGADASTSSELISEEELDRIRVLIKSYAYYRSAAARVG